MHVWRRAWRLLQLGVSRCLTCSTYLVRCVSGLLGTKQAVWVLLQLVNTRGDARSQILQDLPPETLLDFLSALSTCKALDEIAAAHSGTVQNVAWVLSVLCDVAWAGQDDEKLLQLGVRIGLCLTQPAALTTLAPILQVRAT